MKQRGLFYLDLSAAVLGTLLLGTGLLLGVTLSDGCRSSQWLGMTRDTWGDIHLVLALLLVTVLAVHVARHLDFIKRASRACFGRHQALCSVTILLVLLGAVTLPLVVPGSVGRGARGGREQARSTEPMTADALAPGQRMQDHLYRPRRAGATGARRGPRWR